MGDLVRSEPVGIVEQQHRLVRVGQICNVLLHTLAHFCLLDDGQWRWSIAFHYGRLFNRSLNFLFHRSRPLPQAIDADVSRYLVEPALPRRPASKTCSWRRPRGEHFNAVEVEHIELKQYPWFFLARIRNYPGCIRQKAVLPVPNEAAPVPIASPLRHLPLHSTAMHVAW